MTLPPPAATEKAVRTRAKVPRETGILDRPAAGGCTPKWNRIEAKKDLAEDELAYVEGKKERFVKLLQEYPRRIPAPSA